VVGNLPALFHRLDFSLRQSMPPTIIGESVIGVDKYLELSKRDWVLCDLERIHIKGNGILIQGGVSRRDIAPLKGRVKKGKDGIIGCHNHS
jgi:hypothetical protein